ncbi:DUF4247 domain-containing protein [Gordonia sp. NPDC003424]
MSQPPGGQQWGYPSGEDPRRGLRRTRNLLILGVVVAALVAIVIVYSVHAFRGISGDAGARNYISSHYQRDAGLDEGDVSAYIADGSPSTVAADVSGAEQPTDQRTGDVSGANAVAGAEFLQYPDYLVGLFPYGANQTRVMLSRDYPSGYQHYHSYVGGFWVPTPNYAGTGSGYRGGGSGSGGK